jgi:hypothetical protein
VRGAAPIGRAHRADRIRTEVGMPKYVIRCRVGRRDFTSGRSQKPCVNLSIYTARPSHPLPPRDDSRRGRRVLLPAPTGVLLESLHATRGWPVAAVSSAITTHFLISCALLHGWCNDLDAGISRRYGFVTDVRRHFVVVVPW